jgi:hypothetical protein
LQVHDMAGVDDVEAAVAMNDRFSGRPRVRAQAQQVVEGDDLP